MADLLAIYDGERTKDVNNDPLGLEKIHERPGLCKNDMHVVSIAGEQAEHSKKALARAINI